MSTKQATTPAKATTPVAPAATTPVAPAATVVEVIANAAEKIEAAAAFPSCRMPSALRCAPSSRA